MAFWNRNPSKEASTTNSTNQGVAQNVPTPDFASSRSETQNPLLDVSNLNVPLSDQNGDYNEEVPIDATPVSTFPEFLNTPSARTIPAAPKMPTPRFATQSYQENPYNIADEDALPPLEENAYADEDALPPLEENAYADEDALPPLEENAYADEDVLPPLEENAYADEDALPPLEENAYADEDALPPLEENAYADEDALPPLEENAYADEDALPPLEENAYADEDALPPLEENAYADEDALPPLEENAYADEDELPPLEENAYADEDALPPLEENAYADEDALPPLEENAYADEDALPPLEENAYADEDELPPLEEPADSSDALLNIKNQLSGLLDDSDQPLESTSAEEETLSALPDDNNDDNDETIASYDANEQQDEPVTLPPIDIPDDLLMKLSPEERELLEKWSTTGVTPSDERISLENIPEFIGYDTSITDSQEDNDALKFLDTDEDMQEESEEDVSALPTFDEEDEEETAETALPAFDEDEEETAETALPAFDEAEEETAETALPAFDEDEEETAETALPALDETEEETAETALPAFDETEEETAETDLPALDEAEEETAETDLPALDETEEETAETALPALDKTEEETDDTLPPLSIEEETDETPATAFQTTIENDLTPAPVVAPQIAQQPTIPTVPAVTDSENSASESEETEESADLSETSAKVSDETPAQQEETPAEAKAMAPMAPMAPKSNTNTMLDAIKENEAKTAEEAKRAEEDKKKAEAETQSSGANKDARPPEKAEVGSPTFLKNLFSNDNTCVTSPSGSFPIKDDLRTMLALFSNGRFFVTEAFRFDGKVLSFEYMAKKRHLQIGKPEYVSLQVMNSIYEYATQNQQTQTIATEEVDEGPTDQTQARMQRDFVTIISHAAAMHVSDIHIVVADHATIMFRVNGLMQTEMEYNKEWGESFVRAAFASSDISDSNYAQNEYQAAQKLGRTPLRGSNGKLVLPRNILGVRLQFNPIAFGTRYVVLRLLYAEENIESNSGLESLGFPARDVESFRKLRGAPTGITVISGPTGSGKSTTLQRNMIAMLQERNYEINLITVEDPPEYPIPGARQMPVTNAGLEEEKEREFTKALAAALRSDPDSMMIGEVRTLSAADLAFRAALSGHNVWTTLHANSAPAILNRLKDMGVETFKLQDPEIIKGLTAQRLFRKLCPHCRIPASEMLSNPTVQRLRKGFGDIGVESAYLRGRGCKHCDFRGVKGRLAVAEIILPDATFLDLMSKNDTTKAINYWIHDLNGVTLRESALRHMFSGSIDAAEVERWTGFLDQTITG